MEVNDKKQLKEMEQCQLLNIAEKGVLREGGAAATKEYKSFIPIEKSFRARKAKLLERMAPLFRGLQNWKVAKKETESKELPADADISIPETETPIHWKSRLRQRGRDLVRKKIATDIEQRVHNREAAARRRRAAKRKRDEKRLANTFKSEIVTSIPVSKAAKLESLRLQRIQSKSDRKSRERYLANESDERRASRLKRARTARRCARKRAVDLENMRKSAADQQRFSQRQEIANHLIEVNEDPLTIQADPPEGNSKYFEIVEHCPKLLHDGLTTETSTQSSTTTTDTELQSNARIDVFYSLLNSICRKKQPNQPQPKNRLQCFDNVGTSRNYILSTILWHKCQACHIVDGWMNGRSI